MRKKARKPAPDPTSGFGTQAARQIMADLDRQERWEREEREREEQSRLRWPQPNEHRCGCL